MSNRGQKEFLFPYTNRGVGRTLENGLRACVDWVEATFKNVSPALLIADILQLDPSSFSSCNGQNGYRRCLRNGKISVYYDGTEDMGIHLEMKGRGCREYEGYDQLSWKDLFDRMLSSGASFSRLDVAIDDFVGFFTINGIVRKIKNQELVSRFKKAVRFETITINTGKAKGATVYFGAATSDIQIRMYDKLSERIDTDYKVPDDINFWNRTEIQLRNKHAQTVAQILETEEDGEFTIEKTVCGILKEYLRFTVKGVDSNKRRWKTAPFWEKFLGEVEKLPLTTNEKKQPTIEDKKNWIDKQVAPSLAMIYEACGGDLGQIETIITEGRRRLNQRDHALIIQYKQSAQGPLSPSVDLLEVVD